MRQNTAAIIETMQQTKFFLRKNIISEIILTTQVKKSQKVEDEMKMKKAIHSWQLKREILQLIIPP